MSPGPFNNFKLMKSIESKKGGLGISTSATVIDAKNSLENNNNNVVAKSVSKKSVELSD